MAKNGSKEADNRKVEKNNERLTEFCVHHAASSVVLLLLGRKDGIKYSIYKNYIGFLTMCFWKTGAGFYVFMNEVQTTPINTYFSIRLGCVHTTVEWGYTKEIKWVIQVEFCCGIQRGRQKAVRDVNRMEAPSKAKLTASKKICHLTATCCAK